LASKHASAVKAHRQSLVNRERNRQYRSRLRGALRSMRSAIEGNDLSGVKQSLQQTISLIDKMAAKRVIHRNAAARYKSRLDARVRAKSST
jgi:small subunit ribosomal protein S20